MPVQPGWYEQGTPGTSSTGHTVTLTGASGNTDPRQFFTAEDIEKARREERDKLYGRISKADDRFKTLEEEIGTLRDAAAQRAAAEAQARQEAAETLRIKQEEELSARELIQQREQEWQQRFTKFQEEQERARVMYEKDKEHLALKNYIERRAREEMAADNIGDELIDFITGNNPEEVEASIVLLREKTKRILDGIREGQQQVRAGMPGVQGTGQPPLGTPLDNLSGQQNRQMSLEEIEAIPQSEWHKWRGTFGLTGSGSDKGLYA
jgi:DNA repair exonuclease SbcCD ATPase subunit